MLKFPKMRAVVNLSVILFGLVAATAVGVAGTPEIDAALAAHFKGLVPSSYKYAIVDLNGDGIPDAVVLVTDLRYCGSGGCTLVILRGTGHAFSYVSGSTISRAPIRVLPNSHTGWRSLSVTVGGGGVAMGEVLMRFDGARYPLNPTLQPRVTTHDLSDSTTLKLVD